MSADELRRAATSLRERARAATPPADPEPGGWMGFSAAQDPDDGRAHLYGGPAFGGYRSSSVFEFCSWSDCEDCSRPSQEDVDYIATMHPGVGLALADLLEVMARVSALFNDTRLLDRSLTVARLINGGAS